MKVKELIELLQKLDQEALVIMSKDAEGNSFSPLDEVETCLYQPDSTWSGDRDSIFDGDTSSDDFDTFIEDYYSDDIEEGKKTYFELLNSPENQAVCLWPVN